jgi:phosphinothricin acetyltransferase
MTPAESPTFVIEPMTPVDWPRVREIYLEGIATGLATFEQDAPPWEQWDERHLAAGRLVARADGELIGWAALTAVSPRQCYGGVAEASVYVAASARGRGIGRALLEAVIVESERAGFWTLQGSTFADNAPSLRLQLTCGFRVVGRRERIGRLNGVWRDTVLTERRSRAVGGEG